MQKKRWNFGKEEFLLPIGIVLGTVVGIVTDHLALWLSLGVALGVGLDALMRRRRVVAKEEKK